MTQHGTPPPVVRHMLRPESYPHPTAPDIALVETHISWLFLTGPYAYKVKKPVVFDFLDYATLDRRRHFCAEEVRLNRRGAPGLYLGVVAITRDPADGLVLGGTGPVVEYAVKMHQFPPDALFSHLLERGRLAAADAESLAKTVAAYHAAAPREPGRPSSLPEDLHAAFTEDLRTSRRLGVPGPMRDGLETAARHAADFIRWHANLLRYRSATGHVRECHGDLHLDNICRWEGRTLLFDCVEFSETLRRIDTMADAAFAAMDFVARGHPALSNTFANAYAERTGDWEGLRLLPLYACHYAWVRGNMMTLKARAAAAAAGNGPAASTTPAAGAYYRFAAGALLPRTGDIVVVCGPSGSGKSTLARRLAPTRNAWVIRSDAVRKHLFGVRLDEPAGEAAYTDDATDRTYSRLIELGLDLAADAHAVILDARFNRARWRHRLAAAAHARRVPLRFLYCTAPADVLRDRVRRRTGDASDATPDLVAAQLAEHEPLTDRECPHLTRLDTTPPIDAVLTAARAALAPRASTGVPIPEQPQTR